MQKADSILQELASAKCYIQDLENTTHNLKNRIKNLQSNQEQTKQINDELISFYKTKILDQTSSEKFQSPNPITSKILDLLHKYKSTSFTMSIKEENLNRRIDELSQELAKRQSQIEELNRIIEQREVNKESQEPESSNIVRELLEEIDDLKLKNSEISERALNMLSEKELINIELQQKLQRVKEEHLTEIKQHNQEFEKLRSCIIQSVKDFNPEDQVEELMLLKVRIEEKDKSFQIEKIEMQSQFESIEQALKNEVNAREEEISRLKYEIQAKDEEISSIRKSNEELIGKLNTRENEINSLKNSAEEYKQRLEEYNQNEASKESQKLRDVENLNIRLSEQISEFEKQLENLKLDHEKLNEVNGNLQNELENSRQNFRLLQKELELSKKYFDKAKKEYRELNTLYESLKFSNSPQGGLECTEGRQLELADVLEIQRKSVINCKALEKEVDGLRKKLSAKQMNSAKVNRIIGENEILQRENSKLKSELEDLRNLHRVQIRDLETRLRSCKTEYSESRRQLNGNSFNLSNVRGIVETLELEEEREKLKAELKYLTESKRLLEEEIREYRSYYTDSFGK